jgi:hypothetical protein
MNAKPAPSNAQDILQLMAFTMRCGDDGYPDIPDLMIVYNTLMEQPKMADGDVVNGITQIIIGHPNPIHRDMGLRLLDILAQNRPDIVTNETIDALIAGSGRNLHPGMDPTPRDYALVGVELIKKARAKT